MKFKIDETKIILSENQKKIACCDKRVIIAACGRRFGKEVVAAKMVWDMIQKPNTVIQWVMPTFQLVKLVGFNNIIHWFPKSKIELSDYTQKTVKFTNGSEIQFSSTDSFYEVSEDCDFIILDECAFIKETVWNKVKNATVKTLLISTPLGVDSWFYRAFEEGRHKSDTAIYQFSTSEGGFVSEEFIKTARETMSDKMFQQEYLAKFVDLAVA